MATQWFVHADGKQYGPLTPSQLKGMVDQGKVTHDTPVRMGAEGKWVRAGRVKGLLPTHEPESAASPAAATPTANQATRGRTPSSKATPAAADAPGTTSPPSSEKPAAKPKRETVADGKRPAVETPTAGLPARQASPSRWTPASARRAVESPVDEPSRTARDLGIGAGILGLCGLLAFWLPFLGVPLSTIGVLLGVIGIILALVRRGSGLWFSVVGSSIAAIVLGATLFFILRGSEDNPAVAKPTEMTEEERARRRAAMFEAEAEWAQFEAETRWVDATQTTTRGDLRIGVDAVRVQPVPLDDLGVRSETDEHHLQIRLNIEHAGSGPSVRYLGWSGAGSVVDQHVARLSDDTGHEFVRFRPLSGTQIEGQFTTGNILPGDAIKDLLVFELDELSLRRLESVDYLDLELPGEAIGETTAIRFRIPRSMLPQ